MDRPQGLQGRPLDCALGCEKVSRLANAKRICVSFAPQGAPEPRDEQKRLAALEALDLLYTPAEERFDRITRIASQLLDAPIALVTLVARDRQWFKSAHGIDITETPREVAFCGHAILGEDAMVVEDATRDERFAENPLVVGEPHVRFYAGHPIRTEDGSAVGTICVIGRAARAFSERDRSALRDLAHLVEAELHRAQLGESHRQLIAERDELARRASIDALTRVWSREAILQLLAMEAGRAARGAAVGVAMIDVDGFKAVNDAFGHPAGDTALAQIAARIRTALRDFDAVGRYGGDEFLAVLSDCDAAAAVRICERVRASVADAKIGGAQASPMTISIGIAASQHVGPSAEALLAAADRALYVAKRRGRNVVELAAR